MATLIAATASLGIAAVGPTTDTVTPAERQRWVGQFDQCSYNALASALVEAAGPLPAVNDRRSFEEATFVKPLDSVGMGAYYGWAPWTADMINSGQMMWNGRPLTTLHATRFSLATAAMPTVDGDRVVVTYRAGERAALCKRLREEVAHGPVIIWTPYAASLDALLLHDASAPWKHVLRDGDVDRVLFDPNVTHSVTLFARAGDPADAVALTDCSVRNGTFVVPIESIVSTAAAMSASIRVRDDSGSSVFSRGLKGVTDDAFEVAIRRPAPAATQPAAAIDAKIPPDLPANLRAGVARAIAIAGDRGSLWSDALWQAPAANREGAAYLIAGMPPSDLQSLAPQDILAHVRWAYAAFDATPWRDRVPHDVFLQGILPYANLDETREAWEPSLAAIARPLMGAARAPGEAAVAINDGLFEQVHVKYHPTLRPKPNQSPGESIKAGYASCTGLSVLLVDACRSVGVPARVVGTPAWVIPLGDKNGNHAGNHTWVEVWDHRWHALGAAEKGKLDDVWFRQNAQRCATSDDPLHHIYAVTGSTGDYFPMVWNPDDHTIGATNVTATYAR